MTTVVVVQFSDRLQLKLKIYDFSFLMFFGNFQQIKVFILNKTMKTIKNLNLKLKSLYTRYVCHTLLWQFPHTELILAENYGTSCVNTSHIGLFPYMNAWQTPNNLGNHLKIIKNVPS